jgi:hypothetical protein
MGSLSQKPLSIAVLRLLADRHPDVAHSPLPQLGQGGSWRVESTSSS